MITNNNNNEFTKLITKYNHQQYNFFCSFYLLAAERIFSLKIYRILVGFKLYAEGVLGNAISSMLDLEPDFLFLYP